MIELDFSKDKDGLLPAIVQDSVTGEVLMLAYINEQAFRETLKTQKAHYWSRSRKKLWLKGESSGNIQEIKEIRVDCDNDTVIYKVHQRGNAACHKGFGSCFYRKVKEGALVTDKERVFDPADVYKK